MISEKELFYIAKLFFNEDRPLYVLDPGKTVSKNFSQAGFNYVTNRKMVLQIANSNKTFYLINLSGANTFSFPFKFDKIQGIISFNRNIEASVDFFHHQLFYARDINKNIKWILSEKYNRIDFLLQNETFENVIDIANAFTVFPKLIKILRLKIAGLKSVCDGRFQVLLKNRNLFGQTKRNYHSFHVNLFRAEKNQINTVYLFNKNNKLLTLIKLPTSTASAKLIRHMKENLDRLDPNHFNKLAIPLTISNEQGLEFMFSLPFKNTNYLTLQKGKNDDFIEAINELMACQPSQIRIEQIIRKEQTLKLVTLIKQNLQRKVYPHGLSLHLYTRLLKQFTDMINNLPVGKRLHAGYFNNNLVPEHIGVGKHKIAFLNWENVEPDYPLFFDHFEYLFRYVERLEQADVDYLLNDLLLLKEQLEEDERFESQEFDLHLALFIIVRCLKEMADYFNKRVIQPEANLKLVLWEEFLKKYPENLQDFSKII